MFPMQADLLLIGFLIAAYFALRSKKKHDL